MNKIIYNKLIRDKIPQIISNDKSVEGFSIHRVVNEVEKKEYVKAKLKEEIKELSFCMNDEDREINEIVDVIEILFKWVDLNGLSRGELLDKVEDKFQANGGFDNDFILDFVTQKEITINV